MASVLVRGEIYRVRHPQHGDPKTPRCFVVVSRQELLDSKADRVLCAPVNTAGVGLATEVEIAELEGLKHPSVVNCDQITRLEKRMLTDYVGKLSSKKLLELRRALRVAVDVGWYSRPLSSLATRAGGEEWDFASELDQSVFT